MNFPKSIERALQNIAAHGDTDIFPFPFENLAFRDKPADAKAVLTSMHKDMRGWLSRYPPQTMPTLTQVGYTGFRWATLIDPFWNAYYLALVISLADQIESQRVPDTDRIVFSYRYCWQKAASKLFKESTWIDFRKRCLELSYSHPIVVQTDIADFYPRIYHHRIENALHRLPTPGDAPGRIMSLLGAFSTSTHVSYGIPIGGPASRLLSELALNSVDKLLIPHGVKFCRYADDFAIFCADKAEAYRTLVLLSEKLSNEGLALQKKKTRILSADEFQQTAKLLDPADVADKAATEEQRLLGISLRFDPYSPTAVEDYEELKEAVDQIDILGILGREIAKSTIDSTVSKQAIQAVSALKAPQQKDAVRMLLDTDNLMTLAPVFVSIMRIVRDLYHSFDTAFQSQLDEMLCDLFIQRSPLLSVDVNLAYYLQALGGNQTPRKEELLVGLFERSVNPMVRRLIVLIMSRWKCHHWLSDVKNKYGAMSLFEKRAFVLASYILGDEGRHWRDFTKHTWHAPDLFIRDWFAARFQTNSSIPI